MSTLLFVFIIALALSLLLTPFVRKLALKNNLLREPNARDLHTTAKPRVGGIAIYVAFVLPLVCALPLKTDISILLQDYRILIILCGATIMFAIGLIDDIRSLSPKIKLIGQLLVALFTWFGGVQINAVSASLSGGIELHLLSLPVTIFWIVLVTNAINLIDGLDGLAAGVTLLASLLMVLVCLSQGAFLLTLGFTALAGSLLGFLRYNFNPASIFMGDSGSYFLGYTVATLSIFGSVKGQMTLAMLIPFLALGVPIFDALLSPMRRFARGKKIFSPDRKHLHHRLIQWGCTQRQAVLILYGFTILLAAVAFTLVYAKNERAAFILLVPAAALIFCFRKLGYLHYFAVDKMYGWLLDISEVSRLSHSSRSYLDILLNIKSAKDIDEMWHFIEEAFCMIDLTYGRLEFADTFPQSTCAGRIYEWMPKQADLQTSRGSNTEKTEGTEKLAFRMDMPIFCDGSDGENRQISQAILLGTLSVKKDVAKPIKNFTLRRLSQLRRILSERFTELAPGKDA